MSCLAQHLCNTTELAATSWGDWKILEAVVLRWHGHVSAISVAPEFRRTGDARLQ